MPFDTDQDQNKDDNNAGKTAEQIAADQAAQAAAQSAAPDHTSVFLVAGERAFKDADSVVKKIENADSHIATLEAERQADRDRLAEQEAELERLRKIEGALDGKTTGNADETSQLSNEEIAAQAAKLAVGLIEQSNSVAVQEANLESAEAAAKEAYGEGYKGKIADIASELGMTLAAVDALGKQSPSAFAKLLLPTQSGSSPQPTRSSVMPPANNQQGQQTAPVNVTKMREKDRIAHTASLMKEAGVEGY
jgi:hypothetical protein